MIRARVRCKFCQKLFYLKTVEVGTVEELAAFPEDQLVDAQCPYCTNRTDYRKTDFLQLQSERVP